MGIPVTSAARLLRELLLLLLLGLAATAVRAHTNGSTGFASITLDGASVRYDITLATIPPGPLAERMRFGVAGAPVDTAPLLEAVRAHVHASREGRECAPDAGRVAPAKPPATGFQVSLAFTCGAAAGALSLRDDLPDALGPDHHSLALIVWTGGSQQFAFGKDAREVTIAGGGPVSHAKGAGSFFPLGIEHILTGYDHLLFLLALILCGGSLLQLLKIVTAFTLAHSITLALAALDVVVLPSVFVESAIALSIAYVAAENLLPRFALSRRWAVSFAFGLIHGFGFSSVLREIGLPKEGLVLALLNFNLGVEAGQAAVVLVVLPLLIRMRRQPWEPKLVKGVSAVILLVGLALFVDRAFLGG